MLHQQKQKSNSKGLQVHPDHDAMHNRGMALTDKQRGLLRIRAEAIGIAIALGSAAAALMDEFLRWFWLP